MHNWDNVMQSIREVWVPAGGVLAVIIIVTVIFMILKKKGK
ncbi:hypothetical protein [Anaerosacchariphilus polymeriproducens]|nr:hypothetical protein [Anaerosacchariphilus polymeriproducens]